MNKDSEIIKGSGNVYKDFDYVDAEVYQLKAQLAAEIIRVLDKKKLSARSAERETGFAYADFSRIRNADLNRFTIDKMLKILGRLNRKVEVKRFTAIHPPHGAERHTVQ